MAFLVIFGVGILLTLVTFVVGELFDLGGDGDIDSGGGVGEGSASPFSSRVLFIFITAFGGFGYIGESLGWPWLGSSLFALAGGLAVAGGTFLLVILPMARQQGSVQVRQVDFVGLEGEVVVEVPEAGFGRVSLVAPSSGARVVQAARSGSGRRIPAGSIVRVTQVSTGGVTVTPIEQNVNSGQPAG